MTRMIQWYVMALAVAVVPAYAQDSDVSKLREELRQLQQRLQMLEKRLEESESNPGEGDLLRLLDTLGIQE